MFSAYLERLLYSVKHSPAVKETVAFAALALIHMPLVVIAIYGICSIVRYIRRKYMWRNRNE